MRDTDLMTSQNVLANIESDLNQVTTTTDQLSSGLTISQPSDNPYGASLAMQLTGEMSSFGQYSTNVQDGTSWPDAANTTLSQINDIVGRVRELVVEAAN